MAQTRGIISALNDNTKKRMVSPMKMSMTPRREGVPGAMAMRNELKSLRSRTIPKGHPKRGK